jgi:tetratricopeptide (TPR) repeat protein
MIGRGETPRNAFGYTRGSVLLADIMDLLSEAHDAHARGEGYAAIGPYLTAIKELNRRSERLPDSDEARELQAAAHVGLGIVLAGRKSGRAHAGTHFDAAIGFGLGLTGEDPRRSLVDLVATALTERAALYADEDPAAALADYTRAVELRACPSGGDPQRRGALATSYLGRARLRLRTMDHEGAAADATAACEIFHELRATGALDDRCGRGEALLVRAEARLTHVISSGADLDAAAAAIEPTGGAVTTREQQLLGEILLARGRWRRAAGDPTGAHADHEHAVAVSDLRVGSGDADDARALLRAAALAHRASTHADQGAVSSVAADLEQARLLLTQMTATVPYLRVGYLVAEISSSTAFQLRSNELLHAALFDAARLMNAVRWLGGAARLLPALRERVTRLLDRYLAAPLNDATRETFASWRRSLEVA